MHIRICEIELEEEKLPRHLAIIMDGNGRWAKGRGLPRTAGHSEGMKRIRELVENCVEIGIPYLTVFAFSTENWKRSADEVGALMKFIVLYVETEKRRLIRNGVRVQILGDVSTFPPKTREALDILVRDTAGGTKMTFNLALGYGSRAEILHAARLTAEQLPQGSTDEEWVKQFEQNLYTHGMPDPDLIIRTSGEQRISNYLLYQSAYAELYFTHTYWPDFDKESLALALDSYQKRARRFGGV